DMAPEQARKIRAQHDILPGVLTLAEAAFGPGASDLVGIRLGSGSDRRESHEGNGANGSHALSVSP
ncbi:MAG: hypothetical protein D6695_04585, partial [Planctomycetota bacterium]